MNTTLKLKFFLIIILLTSMNTVSAIEVTGELKKWHKVTLVLNGPETSETAKPNPFLYYRLDVTFTHPESNTEYVVPGYFAADGDSADSSADSGNKWQVNFAPDHTGVWNYKVSFKKGNNITVVEKYRKGEIVKPLDGKRGSFEISPSDKKGSDFRAKGRLEYVGKRYLQFAETKEYFLKCGADSPENFLAYEDFDGDFKNDGHKDKFVKSWKPHVKDWKEGDPTWQDGKGKGMIGALNYLASKGMNAVSFIPMNILGDDQNVFPYISYEDITRFDVSRLAQWEIVFSHADKLGIFLHFKLQEMENQGLLDGGGVGLERKLYYRELIARFSHHLALNWNMGEENGGWNPNVPTPQQTTLQRLAMAQYFYVNDPYHHHIVIHNGTPFHDLLVKGSKYTGISLQTGIEKGHEKTLYWINESKRNGFNWVVCHDEQNPANRGVLPDLDTENNHADARVGSLWGNLMAGGGGCEYYFGYRHSHSDLTCQDYSSRELIWNQSRYALEFFKQNNIPFWEMTCLDELTDTKDDYCFAKPGQIYLVYLTKAGQTNLNLQDHESEFSIKWFNPRKGGALKTGKIKSITGPGKKSIGQPPSTPDKDWLAVIKTFK